LCATVRPRPRPLRGLGTARRRRATGYALKARDAAGCLYQIEIQRLTLPELPARILYGWADLYSAQLASGEDYLELKPTYAIWLLGETLLPDVPGYAHRYRFCDAQGRTLRDHGCAARGRARREAVAAAALVITRTTWSADCVVRPSWPA
jgi:hypothetical protein